MTTTVTIFVDDPNGIDTALLFQPSAPSARLGSGTGPSGGHVAWARYTTYLAFEDTSYQMDGLGPGFVATVGMDISGTTTALSWSRTIGAGPATGIAHATFELGGNWVGIGGLWLSSYASLTPDVLVNSIAWMDAPQLKFVGNTGNDTLRGSFFGDIFEGGAGGDSLFGGLGNDTASYESSPAAVTIDLATGAASGGTATGDVFNSIENVTGSDAGDNLAGDALANVLTGLNGNDTLSGRGGNDTLLGGALNDHINGGLGGDYIDGGPGYDFARYDFATIGVQARLDNAALNTGEAAGDTMYNFEGLVGSQQGDILIGNNLAVGNQIYGLGGSDTIRGLGGADTLFGGAGADSYFTGDGTDTVWVQAADLIATQQDRIFDFTDGQDHLRFQGISAASATITDSQGGTLIQFTVAGGQFSVFLDGITKAASADQIFFV